jgi:5-methyltetrahydrofolate--homocysteine methyltransferase
MGTKLKIMNKGISNEIPQPPFWGERVVDSIPLDVLFKNLNIPALFRISWGVKNAKGEKWRNYQRNFGEKLDDFKKELAQSNWLKPCAVYGFFRCYVEHDTLFVIQEKHQKAEPIGFSLPRQHFGRRLSLIDFFKSSGKSEIDLVSFQIVSMGKSAADHIQALHSGKGLPDAYYAHGLAVALTEAAAKLMHKKIRVELKIPENQGKRYSWGYPQIPDLSQHENLFKLLPAEQLGITLTSAYQFVPEYTTAALVLHHENAAYFSMTDQESRK